MKQPISQEGEMASPQKRWQNCLFSLGRMESHVVSLNLPRAPWSLGSLLLTWDSCTVDYCLLGGLRKGKEGGCGLEHHTEKPSKSPQRSSGSYQAAQQAGGGSPIDPLGKRPSRKCFFSQQVFTEHLRQTGLCTSPGNAAANETTLAETFSLEQLCPTEIQCEPHM